MGLSIGLLNSLHRLYTVTMDEKRSKEISEYLINAKIRHQEEVGGILSDKDFAEYLGISQSSYSQFISLIRTPNYESAKKIASVIGDEFLAVCGYGDITHKQEIEMDPKTELTPVQEFLLDAYEEYRAGRRRHYVSDSDFARHLGMSPVTINQYLNGTRKPNLKACIQLSRRLGNKIFAVCGYDPVISVSDPLLMQIINLWDDASSDLKAEVLDTLRGTRNDTYQPPQPTDGTTKGGGSIPGRQGSLGIDQPLEEGIQ
jgi:transcriptional regulator with XRE-family HTH domain